jgi:hypothetical protein
MCRHEGYARKDVSDKMSRAEGDLRLTGKIDVEPGNINFPFGGLLLQAIQFCVGVGCVGF